MVLKFFLLSMNNYYFMSTKYIIIVLSINYTFSLKVKVYFDKYILFNQNILSLQILPFKINSVITKSNNRSIFILTLP